MSIKAARRTVSTRDLATKAKYFAVAMHNLWGRGAKSKGLVKPETIGTPILLRAFSKGSKEKK